VVALGLDLLLLPGHPDHRDPLPGERACFREGTIVFPAVRDLHWAGQGNPPAVDVSGTRDYGSVDSLTGDGGTYRLLGDWREITVESAAPVVSIDAPVGPASAP
jgi:hypothetical protein